MGGTLLVELSKVFQNHNHTNFSRDQALNLIHQKNQIIHRGYLVLGVVIGIVISDSVGLIAISTTPLNFIFYAENIVFPKD